MEMIRLEKPVTSMTQIDMTKAVAICPVTARAEQIPRTSKAMGLRLKTDLTINSDFVSAIDLSSIGFQSA